VSWGGRTESAHGYIAPRHVRRRRLVHLYLVDVGRHPLLSKRDEVELAQRIEAGAKAREQLGATDRPRPAARRELARRARDGDSERHTFVVSNLRLVVSIAKNYRSSGLQLLDLVQEGNPRVAPRRRHVRLA
jgi:DNA-directed RNA polymerase sigma subunit (sigma70/sigma32)